MELAEIQNTSKFSEKLKLIICRKNSAYFSQSKQYEKATSKFAAMRTVLLAEIQSCLTGISSPGLEVAFPIWDSNAASLQLTQ